MEAEWKAVSGRGKIVSWVVFHRKYFDDFPPPYNATTVRLEEGPLIVTNLTGPEPEGSWIGRSVALEYVDHDGRKQHAARIVD
ncbi:OB-fold domain-containing protein [Mesorhizobium sp. CGMCC 1.15528]|uniref:OB-fold domain-containing protein n=1 Tax=Mesorhizobium zhangyense TaxID=1776730 RepID=A0A7C9R7J6_9HYPH|nr:OB-fold domain-containing protein [Mesorhizobium zhangyense]NGN41756.1 OB-fold domain-containing protein [Mesorhizobium zhangyense]